MTRQEKPRNGGAGEWGAETPIFNDPAGNNAKGITKVYVKFVGDRFFMMVEAKQTISLAQEMIYFDYDKDGKLDLAEQHLKRAADQLLTNSVVQDHYGDVLFRLGRFDDAIAAWSRALSGDREDVDQGGIDRKIRSAKQKLPRR